MAKQAIVMGITADIAFAAGTLLASILAQDPGFDADVVIFHDGLAEDQQAAFLALWPRCHFRSFTVADVEARLKTPITAPKVADYFQHLTHMVMAKLELPVLLEEYERVVWLDADMLVRGPLTGLWDFDCIAWRPLPPGAYSRRARVLAAYAGATLDPAVPLLNGGTIGLGQGFREKGGSPDALHDVARDLILRAPSTQLAEMPWYLVAALLSLPVTSYPRRFNHSVAAPGVADATIVHAIGPHKFWNAAPLRQLFPDWLQHQQTWVAAGGVPFDGPILLTDVHPEDAAQVLKAAETRDYWLRAWRRLRPLLPPGFQVDLRHDQPFLTIYLQGRPEAEHLRLVRLPNRSRIGLQLHLPEASQAWEAVQAAVPTSREVKDDMRSFTVLEIGPALAALAAVLA